MKGECVKMNLQYDKAPDWGAKCVQLLESYYVRHGIGIVGPTGSGKTMMQEVLSRGLTITDTKHAEHVALSTSREFYSRISGIHILLSDFRDSFADRLGTSLKYPRQSTSQSTSPSQRSTCCSHYMRSWNI